MIIIAQTETGVIADGAAVAGEIVMVGASCVGILIVAGGIMIDGIANVGVGAGGAGLGAVVKLPILTGPSIGWITCTDQK